MKKKSIMVSLLIILLIPMISASTSSLGITTYQQARFTISGTVYQVSNGALVTAPYVDVKIVSYLGTTTVKTDSSGRFSTTLIYLLSYKVYSVQFYLTVSKDGQFDSESLIVANGGSGSVNLYLGYLLTFEGYLYNSSNKNQVIPNGQIKVIIPKDSSTNYFEAYYSADSKGYYHFTIYPKLPIDTNFYVDLYGAQTFDYETQISIPVDKAFDLGYSRITITKHIQSFSGVDLKLDDLLDYTESKTIRLKTPYIANTETEFVDFGTMTYYLEAYDVPQGINLRTFNDKYVSSNTLEQIIVSFDFIMNIQDGNPSDAPEYNNGFNIHMPFYLTNDDDKYTVNTAWQFYGLVKKINNVWTKSQEIEMYYWDARNNAWSVFTNDSDENYLKMDLSSSNNKQCLDFSYQGGLILRFKFKLAFITTTPNQNIVGQEASIIFGDLSSHDFFYITFYNPSTDMPSFTGTNPYYLSSASGDVVSVPLINTSTMTSTVLMFNPFIIGNLYKFN